MWCGGVADGDMGCRNAQKGGTIPEMLLRFIVSLNNLKNILGLRLHKRCLSYGT